MSDDENRKRVHQDDHEPAVSSKRAAIGSSSGGTTTPTLPSEEPFLFKVLCPQSITGLIIGKKGCIINQLNQSTGARIRLSQNHEFFPGTSDRILLISGTKECIGNALHELVTRIAEAPDKRSSTSQDMYGNPVPSVNRGSQGTFLIRVLIPKGAAAAIIGRKGAVIQRMGEMSSCRLQMGDESDPYNTRERILMINSTSVQNLVLGSQTLMAELLNHDAKVRSYPNTTTNYTPGYPVQSPPSVGSMGNPGMLKHSPTASNSSPYPTMSNVNPGPPPLLPVMNPAYAPPPGYPMASFPQVSQYMAPPQAYHPGGIPQPFGVNMMQHSMPHPGMLPPQMYILAHQQQQQHYAMNGGMNGSMSSPMNGGMPPPVTAYPPYAMPQMNHPDAPQHPHYQIAQSMSNLPPNSLPSPKYGNHNRKS